MLCEIEDTMGKCKSFYLNKTSQSTLRVHVSAREVSILT